MARIKKIRRPGSPVGRVQRPNRWLKYGAEAGDPCAGGPSVRILQVNSCGCSFTAPATDCVVQCRYEARWGCYTNTPNQFSWANVNEVGTLIAGGGLADDFAVYETTAATDQVLDVNVTATDTVSGDTDSYSKDFTHTHSDDTVAPFFKGPDINNVSFASDTPISTFDFSQVFGGYITSYALVGNWPAGVSIDNNGLLTGTPTGVAIYDSLTVEASGPGGTATTNPFTVTIYNATAESLEVSQVQAAACSYNSGIGQTECGAPGIYTATPVGWTTPPDSWIWGISSTSVGITAQIVAGQGTDTVDVDVTGAADGSITLRCEASNTNGELASDLTQFFTSHTDTVEDIVFIGPNIGDLTITVDVPFTLDASTLFTGTITGYTLGGSWPGGFAIDENGVITGTTTSEAFYSNAFVRADNSVDFAISDIFDIYSVPAAPVFNGSIPLMVGTEGEAIAEYDASLHYQTGGAVSTYSLVNGQWLTIGASTGLINGTPPTGNDLIGAYVVGTNSTDSDNSNTFNVDVTAALNPPVWISDIIIPNQDVDTVFSYDASVHVTGATSYQLQADPSGLFQVDGGTGVLSTIAATLPSTPVTISGLQVRAINADGNSSSNVFGFEVEAAAGYGNDFVFTVTTPADNTTFTLGLYFGSTYNFHVIWGDGNEGDVTDDSDATKSNTYATAGTYQVRISGQATSIRMSLAASSAALITSVEQLGDLGYTNFFTMFSGCSNMTTFTPGAVANANTATNMRDMFSGCSSLTDWTFDGFDTSGITEFRSTLSGCTSLDPDLSTMDVSSGTDFTYLLSNTVISNANYDKTLLAWSQLNVQSGNSINFYAAKYTETAARAILTDPPNNWDISDGGPA